MPYNINTVIKVVSLNFNQASGIRPFSATPFASPSHGVQDTYKYIQDTKACFSYLIALNDDLLLSLAIPYIVKTVRVNIQQIDI